MVDQKLSDLGAISSVLKDHQMYVERAGIGNRISAQDFKHVYDAKDYGVIGNGIVDDTAAIQAAWNALKATGGKLVLPSNGTLLITSTLDFSSSVTDFQKYFKIEGNNSKIIYTNLAIGIDAGGTNNLNIDDLHILASGAANQVGLWRYRLDTVPGDGPGSYHHYHNLCIEGSFTAACLYSVGSEVNEHIRVDLLNSGSGACYASSSFNFLSVTGNKVPLEATSSNTVNNFYGGRLISGSTGSSILLNGIADNLNFYGTYLVGVAGGYNVRLGVVDTDWCQGKVVFDGVRFEGTTHAIYCRANTVWGLNVFHSHFGERGAGQYDIYQPAPGSPGGGGLIGCNIEGNFHLGQGITLLNGGSGTRIVIPRIEGGGGSDTTITTVDACFGCHFDAPVITNDQNFGSSVRVETLEYTKKIRIGPSDPNPYMFAAAYGAVLIESPFGIEPVTKEVGLTVTADGTYWRPNGYIDSKPYSVFYDGVDWKPLSMPWFEKFDIAAPGAGVRTWAVGDRVWNSNPTSGGYIGWVCTAAGDPGTWKGFGAIA